MGEIKSNVGAASGHSGAIGSAAGSLTNGLSAVGASQANNPESSLISCFACLQSAITSLAGAISADAGSIEAIGDAISSMDDGLSRGFLP